MALRPTTTRTQQSNACYRFNYSLYQGVRRNAERFPAEFVFRLTLEESQLGRSDEVPPQGGPGVRSQIVTASKRNIRYLPYAFTEHGALIAANVLGSPRAIRMSVAIIQTFVRLRRIALSFEEVARHRVELELSPQHNTVAAPCGDLLLCGTRDADN